jgi:hypothetical protein
MRTVLIGTDFMYDINGNLKPIEINTNIGIDGFSKIESNSEIFDLTALANFIETSNFTNVHYIGNLTNFFSLLTGLTSVSCEHHKTLKDAITVPYIEDNDETLIIRSTYDTTALVDDTYCRDKIGYLKLIQSQSFGSEFAYKDTDGTLISNIVTILDNGIHPNFILKYRYPNYDNNEYPKLYKVSNQDELNILLNNLPTDYYLTTFYFNNDKLYNNHITITRSINLLLPPDLRSLEIGSYTNICDNSLPNTNSYNPDTFELIIDDKGRYLSTPDRFALPKLLDNDEVEMSDGTFKTAIDLEIGDIIKTIDIPNPFNVESTSETTNYFIDYATLVSGTTYSTNKVLNKVKVNRLTTLVDIEFEDGSNWKDTESSHYLVERDNQIKFIPIDTLIANDKIILIDTTNQNNVTFVEKIVKSLNKTQDFFTGWAITVERTHLFLTKTQTNTSNSYVTIEHNLGYCNPQKSGCSWCSAFGCPDCPKGRTCMSHTCVNYTCV